MRRLFVLVVSVCLLVQACSSEASLTVYAEDAETLVTTMNARIDELDTAIAGSNDLETVQWFAGERIAARIAFLDGLGALDPPDGLAEFHAAALDIIGRLVAAESVLNDRVQAMQADPVGVDMWATPEGQAARIADAEAIKLCLAAEAELDTNGEGAKLDGVPWIPPEMKETVRVAFGCVAEDR